MSKAENPFAFPMAVPGDCMQQPSDGMTLRDWFAGQVMASAYGLPYGDADYSLRAKIAYEQADAMLRERAKGGAA